MSVVEVYMPVVRYDPGSVQPEHEQIALYHTHIRTLRDLCQLSITRFTVIQSIQYFQYNAKLDPIVLCTVFDNIADI